MGGIVAVVLGKNTQILTCYNSGMIDCSVSDNDDRLDAGGITASAYYGPDESITNCYNLGNIKIDSGRVSNVGGLMGIISGNNRVENCHSSCSITTTDVAGEFIGYVKYNNDNQVVSLQSCSYYDHQSYDTFYQIDKPNDGSGVDGVKELGQMKSVLEVLNSEDAFVEGVGEYPILRWQTNE